MPRTAPIARNAPAVGAGSPISRRIGATIAPAESTEAVEEPVTMPGNITMIIKSTSITAGTL